MGSDFVSSTEAAKLLGRSKRTVVAYQQLGVLRRVRQGKTVLIPKEDVDALAVEIGAHLPVMNRKTFFQLAARVERLEASMAVLKRATGLHGAPMRPTQEIAVGFYDMAKRALLEKSWSLEEIEMWADQLECMDEVFFDALAGFTGDGEAWRPFYSLCLAQAKQIVYDRDYAASLRIQKLHERLCAALKMLRGIILVWVEAGGGSALARTFPEEALVQRLSAKAG